LECLKKIILAEAYHDVMAEKDGAHPPEITALDPGSSLYKAIQEGTRGSPDYPSSLALTPQEKASLANDVPLYAAAYTDAYVVAAQCALLGAAPAALGANDPKVLEPAGVFTDSAFALLEKETDKAIFICHDNYTRNGSAFTGGDLAVGAGKPTNFRALQRDSARCYLLLILVIIRAYVAKATSDLKQGSLNAAEVARYLIDKLQKLKYGVGVLAPKDIHVDQIGIVLRGVLKSGQAVLEAAGILADFQYITEFMLVPANRGKPLDQSKLSQAAKAVPDYNTGNRAELMLPEEYVRVTKALRERAPEEWAAYKSFAKIFKKQESMQTPRPATSASNRRDTEMSGGSPGKGADGGPATPEDDDPLSFDLCERHQIAFT
jgi:hypothetical protein